MQNMCRCMFKTMLPVIKKQAFKMLKLYNTGFKLTYHTKHCCILRNACELIASKQSYPKSTIIHKQCNGHIFESLNNNMNV